MGRYVVLALVLAGLLVALACDEAVQKGTITGTVKDGGQPVNGAYVLLLDEGELVQGNTPLSNGSITLGNGSYTIVMVEPNKNYYVAAVKDQDGNGNYTPGVDPIGYYGTLNQQTGVWIPASIHVGEGQKLSGINVNDLMVIPIPIP